MPSSITIVLPQEHFKVRASWSLLRLAQRTIFPRIHRHKPWRGGRGPAEKQADFSLFGLPSVPTVALTPSPGNGPFVMGINTSVMRARQGNGPSSESQCFFSPKPQARDRRQYSQLKIRRRRNKRILGGDPHHRSIQRTDTVLRDARRHFRAAPTNSRCWEGRNRSCSWRTRQV